MHGAPRGRNGDSWKCCGASKEKVSERSWADLGAITVTLATTKQAAFYSARRMRNRRERDEGKKDGEMKRSLKERKPLDGA